MTQAVREHPLLPKAWSSFQQGDVEQATRLCRQVIDESPAAAPQAWLLIAVCALREGKVDDAEDALSEIPDRVEWRVPTTIVRAQCALAQEDYPSAKAAFMVALDYQPDSGEALYGLAQARLALGESKAARDTVRKLVSLAPDHAAGQFLLGVAALGDDDAVEAVSAFSAAARLLPESPEVYNNLGLAFQMAGESVKAEKQYRRAVELNESFGHAWYNLAAIVGAQGKLDEANQCYEKAVALDDTLEAHGKPWEQSKA